MLPAGYQTGWRRRWWTVVGATVMALFDLNAKLISRSGQDFPPVWDTDDLPWLPPLVDAVPQIRQELDAYLAEVVMPQTLEVSGLEPDSEAGTFASPGLQGVWRSTFLYLTGRWLAPSAHFPTVRTLVGDVRGLTSLGFAGLDGHSHIDDHVDPNKGALRFHLPIVVPGAEGDCRIRIVDRVVPWRVGEPLLFDLAAPHEVWNDTDSPRIVLMMELVAPLRFPLSVVNRFVQWTYRAFPSYLGLPDRVVALEARGRRQRSHDTATA